MPRKGWRRHATCACSRAKARTAPPSLRCLHRTGYRGDYSFDVFTDDYQQLPSEFVARRAHRSAKWVTDQVLRRSLQVRQAAESAAMEAGA